MSPRMSMRMPSSSASSVSRSWMWAARYCGTSLLIALSPLWLDDAQPAEQFEHGVGVRRIRRLLPDLLPVDLLAQGPYYGEEVTEVTALLVVRQQPHDHEIGRAEHGHGDRGHRQIAGPVQQRAVDPAVGGVVQQIDQAAVVIGLLQPVLRAVAVLHAD